MVQFAQTFFGNTGQNPLSDLLIIQHGPVHVSQRKCRCNDIDIDILLRPFDGLIWDVEFKVHAPYRTVVEGRVEKGKLVELRITPAGRRDDVILAE